MKFKLFLILGLIASQFSYSQSLIETKFFDENWREASPANFQTKREIFKECDTLYIIKDYYKGIYLEMTGSLSHLNPDIENGLFIFYDEKGNILQEIEYSNGEPMNCYSWKGKKRVLDVDYSFSLKYYQKDEVESTDENPKYFIIEDMPVFQNGPPENFKLYIQKNLKYPRLALKYKNSGTVKLTFVVSEDGSLTNVEVIESINKTLDKEAVRVVRNSPKWRPGQSQGKKYRVRFKTQADFKLP
jgi:TonB family protein